MNVLVDLAEPTGPAGPTNSTDSTNPTKTAAAALGAVRRARTVASRAAAMDPAAVVRLRPVGAKSVDLFISTPLGCVVAQRIPGRLPGADAPTVAHLAGALTALGAFTGDEPLDFGPECPLLWRGGLPPEAGYTLVDTIPAEAIRTLHADMAAENSQHGGPLGIARSLLEQKVLGVASNEENDGNEVALEGRIVAAMGALGLVQEPRGAMSRYDFARVSVTGSWIRVDGLYGSIYAPRPGGLARVP